MKNAEKKRESNFFEGIVSEEMNELSETPTKCLQDI